MNKKTPRGLKADALDAAPDVRLNELGLADCGETLLSMDESLELSNRALSGT